jgi:hypothetical protein
MAASAVRYQHTQRGAVLLLVLSAAAVVCVYMPTLLPGPQALLLMVGAVLCACAVLFSSLTIQITDRALRWYFSFGIIRKEVPLAEIRSAEVARTRLIHGWGIHATARGWLYNVSGFKAVAVRLKSGKGFLLGTDEPEQLCAVILRAIG